MCHILVTTSIIVIVAFGSSNSYSISHVNDIKGVRVRIREDKEIHDTLFPTI